MARSAKPPMPQPVAKAGKVTAEIGRVGTYRYSGTMYEEFLKELHGRKGVETYKEMSENSDVIGAILFAVENLMRQCTFTIKPGGNQPIDKEAADFVQGCMDDMQETWTDTLSEIISFLVYGWSYHEIVYKRRLGRTNSPMTNSKYNDGLIGWRKLPIRAQETLFEWRYDDNSDELLGMVQTPPPDYQNLFIPLEKALHFKTRSRKSNPEGRSILRNAYQDWYYVKRIRELEGMAIERSAIGLPVMTAPEGMDLWNDEDPDMVNARSNAEFLVSAVRADKIDGVVLPPGWTLDLKSTSSNQKIDIGEVINRYNKLMATTVLADFIFLGQSNVGSFALSSNKTKLFAVAVGTYLDIICEVFNNQAIPRLIDVNGQHFQGITDYPTMTHSDIEDPDLEKLSAFVSSMIGSAVLTPTEDLEKYLRQVANLPEKIEGEEGGDVLPPATMEDDVPDDDKKPRVTPATAEQAEEDAKDQQQAESAKKSLGRDEA